jgi:hypothetical protein
MIIIHYQTKTLNIKIYDPMNTEKKIYDFYYSAEQERVLIRIARSQMKPYYHCRFNGLTYTEMITSGKPPLSNYDDLRLIGTGTSDGVKTKVSYP